MTEGDLSSQNTEPKQIESFLKKCKFLQHFKKVKDAFFFP